MLKQKIFQIFIHPQNDPFQHWSNLWQNLLNYKTLDLNKSLIIYQRKKGRKKFEDFKLTSDAFWFSATVGTRFLRRLNSTLRAWCRYFFTMARARQWVGDRRDLIVGERRGCCCCCWCCCLRCERLLSTDLLWGCAQLGISRSAKANEVCCCCCCCCCCSCRCCCWWRREYDCGMLVVFDSTWKNSFISNIIYINYK